MKTTQLLARACVCIACIFVLIILSPSEPEQEEWRGPLDIEIPPFILSSVAQTNVSTNFLPAAVAFVNGKGKGKVHLGNIVVDNRGTTQYIATAGHLYTAKIRRGWSFYRPLRPLGDAWITIEKVCNLRTKEGEELDVALCIPGESKPIEGFSRLPRHQNVRVKTVRITDWPMPRSVLNGAHVPILGVATTDKDKVQMTLFLRESIEGESGYGLLASENRLYLILQSFEPNQRLREWLHIPPSFRSISAARALNISLD